MFTNEVESSVLEALDNGEPDKSLNVIYLKMEREKAHFELTVAERRKRKKEFGQLNESKQLLLINIEEIAFYTGFNNQTHFNRVS